MTKKLIKYIATVCLTPMIAMTASANGTSEHSSLIDGKNYFKIKAGVDKPGEIGGNTNLGSGKANYVVGIALGRKIFSYLLVDLEYMHFGKNEPSYVPTNSSPNNINSWGVQSDLLMANVRLNLLKNFEIMPYIKAGAGASINKSSNFNTTSSVSTTSYGGKTINSFAWQVGLGLSFEYNEKFGTELEYTYLNRGSVKTQDSYTTTLGNAITTGTGGIYGTLTDNIVTFGIKYKF